MIKFAIGFAVGAVALAYYPVYIDDVKSVTNSTAKAVVDATQEQSLVDRARDLVE